jgi:HK97 family phage prohead protease
VRLAGAGEQAEARTLEAEPEIRATSTTGRPTVRRSEERSSIGALEGHAAVFYDGTAGTEFQLWEDLWERVMPGAFDDALRRGDDARGLFNHDANQLLGRVSSGTVTLRTDKRGLAYRIELPDTTLGRDVLTLAKREDISGSSYAFLPLREALRMEWVNGKEKWIREIESVELFDVSPVVWPAFTATDVAPARSGPSSRPSDAELTEHLLRVRARAVEVLSQEASR